MQYSRSLFTKALDNYSGISISGDNAKNADGTYKYTQESGSSKLNSKLAYSKGGFNYSTWYQETSTTKDNNGILVTCKIDYSRTMSEDDHVGLSVGFKNTDNGPILMFAQVFINFQNSENCNIISPIESGDDIAGQICNYLTTQINSKDFGSFNSTKEGRQSIPDIVKANIIAMQNSIS